MRLELHPEARLEFLDAVAHYESCHSGLGERFIQSINSALASISENPKTWAEIEQDIRRKLTRVFPYALLYTIEPDYILIVAVMHCHREPTTGRSGFHKLRLITVLNVQICHVTSGYQEKTFNVDTR